VDKYVGEKFSVKPIIGKFWVSNDSIASSCSVVVVFLERMRLSVWGIMESTILEVFRVGGPRS